MIKYYDMQGEKITVDEESTDMPEIGAKITVDNIEYEIKHALSGGNGIFTVNVEKVS